MMRRHHIWLGCSLEDTIDRREDYGFLESTIRTHVEFTALPIMMSQTIEQLIDAVSCGHDLSREQSELIFGELTAGRLSEQRVMRFLTALADKGETAEEIVGAAVVLRRHVVRVACDAPSAIDTCGTGGDGISTFNVSTVAAIVAAAAGATVAKHGNRSNSRKSGSAEVLAALGVNIEATPEQVARCIREVGIGFLFAAHLHPAMKHVAAIRRKIGRPTIFNLLGPLTNPAFVRRQIIGVPRLDLMDTLARTLKQLDSTHVFVVHGHDGLCDLTITGPSSYVELHDGRIAQHILQPQDVGLSAASLDDLRIDSPTQSAEMIRSILDGRPGPPRDHTLLNAAAALVVAGIAGSLSDGVQRAASAIDNGAAIVTLKKLVAVSGEKA